MRFAIVCVLIKMLNFGAGGLPVPIAQTRSLILVMLRRCLADSTIQPVFLLLGFVIEQTDMGGSILVKNILLIKILNTGDD